MRSRSIFACLVTLLLGACAGTMASKSKSGSAILDDPSSSLQTKRQLCAALDAQGLLEDPSARYRCAELEVAGGVAAQGEGNAATALYRLQQALIYDPDHSRAWEAIGHVFVAQRQWLAACEAFGDALARDPFNFAAKRGRAECLIGLGEFEAAELVIMQCEGADDLECHCGHGRDALVGLHPLPPGLTPADLASQCPQMHTLTVEQCQQRLAQGDCRGAAAACKEALVEWPDNREARRAWRSAQQCVLAERHESDADPAEVASASAVSL